MADEKTFSNIAVSHDDEDDFVIQAGVLKEAAASSQVRSADVVALSVQAQSASVRGKDKEYRETKLDDLKAAPMPLAQKIVIIVAALLVVLFLVYYFFLR